MANCEKYNCTHYVDKLNMRLYKGKFFIAVVLITIVMVVLFGCEVYFYHSSLQSIVNTHSTFITSFEKTIDPLTVSKDSCVYANEQLVSCMREYMQSTQNVLELQSNKIQADFTLLSLWAGILMIVFLIFSIYSMFKTDELMKQGREGLRAIEASKAKADEQVETIDKKVESEIQKVSSAANSQLTAISEESEKVLFELKQSIEAERKAFKDMVDQKAVDFNGEYIKYVEKLKSSTESAKNLWQSFMDAIRNNQESEQESKSTN